MQPLYRFISQFIYNEKETNQQRIESPLDEKIWAISPPILDKDRPLKEVQALPTNIKVEEGANKPDDVLKEMVAKRACNVWKKGRNDCLSSYHLARLLMFQNEIKDQTIYEQSLDDIVSSLYNHFNQIKKPISKEECNNLFFSAIISCAHTLSTGLVFRLMNKLKVERPESYYQSIKNIIYKTAFLNRFPCSLDNLRTYINEFEANIRDHVLKELVAKMTCDEWNAGFDDACTDGPLYRLIRVQNEIKDLAIYEQSLDDILSSPLYKSFTIDKLREKIEKTKQLSSKPYLSISSGDNFVQYR